MKALFRTEGNNRQGLGDVYGCLAIAAALGQHGYDSDFVFCLPENCADIVVERGYRAHQADGDALQLMAALAPDVIIVNMLDSAHGYIEGLRALGATVVTIDDTASGAQAADLRINPLYHTKNAVCDTKFVMLRDVFAELHAQPRSVSPEVDKLLIMQGGADTYGFLPKLIDALGMMSARPDCTVVVGAAFRHEIELEQAVYRSPLEIRVCRNVPDIERLMQTADLAISAAGLSVFELACLGTPTVTVCAEPFEIETAERLAANDAIVNLGFGGDLDMTVVPETIDTLAANYGRRLALSTNAHTLVDGRGSERIAQAIVTVSGRATCIAG